MAISENLKRNTSKEAKAEQFIAEAGKPKRGDSPLKPIMIRIPQDMLERIDRAARRLGINRTAFIVSSAGRELERMES
jgi:Ribbon-helix-helix protein, copG family